MNLDTNPLLAVALGAALLLAGCVGTQGDADLASQSADEADIAIAIEAENPGDVNHLGFELDRVLAHDANVSLPDGFHEVALAAGHADVVHDGEADRVEIAAGTVPAGTYDQVLLRLTNATVEAGGSSGSDGHDHGDGEDGHDHGSEGASATAVSTGSLDLPLNASFEATPGEMTEIVFTLDVSDSYDGDSFTPEFASAEVLRGNETVSTASDLETRANPDADVPQDPPAARLAVFAPNGDQVYEPAFDPKDGEFVNSIASGFEAGEDVQFTATESEPVAQGAALDSYEWSFGDGATATGRTASHAYEQPGVYEVELTVTDSYGNEASHMVRLVTVGWTQTLADTSFEDSTEWSDETSDEEVNQWQLAEPGHGNSSTAWHVGYANEAEQASETGGYGPTTEPVRLVSPEYEIPEDFKLAGFEVFVDGYASAGTLQLIAHVGDESRTLDTIDGEVAWKRVGALDALEGAAGSTVQFEMVFTSPADTLDTREGPGYAVDSFTLAGMAQGDLVNSSLLEEAGGGHDGHDHEH